ncbi:unnamed protein product [Nippostrongylus brasiliensis]|uniref:C2 domain-containing protein n=1 Tax=Nippostrongylus brasiliensis TaxID=27835 RepID=A0A158R2I1_NIPBR|nr:unnamed protein product [Nippostrongylus brasiliensis]
MGLSVLMSNCPHRKRCPAYVGATNASNERRIGHHHHQTMPPLLGGRRGDSKEDKIAAAAAELHYGTAGVRRRHNKVASRHSFKGHELEINQQRIEVDVELWDCSGDLKYDEFIATSDIDPENVLVVLNEIGEKRTNDSAISDFQLPHQLSSAVCAPCNLYHEGEQLRLEFNQFLVTIIAKTEVDTGKSLIAVVQPVVTGTLLTEGSLIELRFHFVGRMVEQNELERTKVGT